MPNTYTAITKKDGDWWIGWIEEVPGVNCQERTHEELVRSLEVTLEEALDFNRQEAIVERYQRTIYNVAYRMVRDEGDAADITQTVFIKVYRKLDRYDPDRKFFSWLYRIAVNECLNYIKKRKHEVVADGDYAVSRMSPWDDVARGERSELLEGALMDLKPEHRVVIVLKYFLEFSYREISDIAGIPEKTVKSRLFTARRQMRDALMGLGYRR